MPSDKGSVRFKLLEAHLGQGEGKPGETLDDALLIACGEGALRLVTVQREGKGPMSAPEFLRGTPVPAGRRLA
jgi:methionyl-tRNA formyltransferase